MHTKVEKYKYVGVECKTVGCRRNARVKGYCLCCYNKKLLRKRKEVKNAIL